MTFRRLSIAAFAISVALGATAPQASAQLVTKPISKPLLVTAWNYIIHIKSIEAVYPIGTPKFATKMNDCAQGYILVVASLQNNASSGRNWLPGVTLGFELADGSQMIGPKGDGTFIYPSFARPPTGLYAKEHLDVAFVTCPWTGQPITKIVIANKYRLLVPKNFVKMHITPSPAPSP